MCVIWGNGSRKVDGWSNNRENYRKQEGDEERKKKTTNVFNHFEAVSLRSHANDSVFFLFLVQNVAKSEIGVLHDEKKSLQTTDSCAVQVSVCLLSEFLDRSLLGAKSVTSINVKHEFFNFSNLSQESHLANFKCV